MRKQNNCHLTIITTYVLLIHFYPAQFKLIGCLSKIVFRGQNFFLGGVGGGGGGHDSPKKPHLYT